jgi:hypothetical protein
MGVERQGRFLSEGWEKIVYVQYRGDTSKSAWRIVSGISTAVTKPAG